MACHMKAQNEWAFSKKVKRKRFASFLHVELTEFNFCKSKLVPGIRIKKSVWSLCD